MSSFSLWTLKYFGIYSVNSFSCILCQGFPLQIIHFSAIASLHDCQMTAMKCRSKFVKRTSFNLLQHFYVKQNAPLSPKRHSQSIKPNITLISLSISPFADDSFFVLRMEHVNLKHYKIMLIRQRVRWFMCFFWDSCMMMCFVCQEAPFFFFLLLVLYFDGTLCNWSCITSRFLSHS